MNIIQLKNFSQKHFPALYELLRFRIGHPATMSRIAKIILKSSNGKVMAGPFAGLSCGETVTGSLIPKMIGSYELELNDVIEQIIQRQPPLIIDVGCGEGYYAVGLAMRIPTASIIGFDTNAQARLACTAQAALNKVSDQVHVGDLCTPARLAELAKPGTLVIADCEGFEEELLQPDRVPQLLKCDILVELHEHFSPGVTKKLLDRFSATHSIHLIDSKLRDPDAYPALFGLSLRKRRLAIDECRYGPMQWAWMTCRSSNNI